MHISSLLGRRAACALGLDIGSSSVKLVEMECRGHHMLLRHGDRSPLGQGWVVDGRIENPREVAAVIRGLLEKTGTKKRQVVLALPTAAVITRQVLIPRGLTELEIEQQVEMEARHAMGLPLEALYLDFCADDALSDHPNKVAIQMVGVRRERIDDLCKLCESSGLEPVAVDIQNAALSRAMVRVLNLAPPSLADAIFLQFNWGVSTVSTQAFQHSKPIYWHVQSRVQAHHPPHRGALLKDIENGLQQFLQHVTASRVNAMYLAGGAALTEGMCEWATQATDIPCQVLDPFEGLTVHHELDPDALRKEAAHYVSACGLALRVPTW